MLLVRTCTLRVHAAVYMYIISFIFFLSFQFISIFIEKSVSFLIGMTGDFQFLVCFFFFFSFIYVLWPFDRFDIFYIPHCTYIALKMIAVKLKIDISKQWKLKCVHHRLAVDDCSEMVFVFFTSSHPPRPPLSLPISNANTIFLELFTRTLAFRW